MKKFFRVFVAGLFLYAIFITSCPIEIIEDDPWKDAENIEDSPWEELEHLEFVSSMKIGWNLGNALDAHSNGNHNETAWGNPRAKRELINAVANQGFGVVRIPVTWGNMIGPAPNYKVEGSLLSRVAEIVEWTRSAGMRAIINIHHDGADSSYWLSVRSADLTGENKEAIDAKFSAVWKQIAEYFKNHGNYLIFEGFNELHDGGWGYTGTRNVHGVSVTTTSTDLTNQRIRVNELNQMFVNTVRAVGNENTNRYLLIHGLVTRPSETWASHFTMPNDPAKNRLIVGIHFYDPYQFTGDAIWTTWGQKVNTTPATSENNWSGNNWANESNVRNQFDQIENRFIKNNIPVIIGEYGAVNQAPGNPFAYRKYYMEYVTKAAVDRGLIPFYWDNAGFGTNSPPFRFETDPPNWSRSPSAYSEKFGIINRTNGTASDSSAAEIINIMMKAAKTNYSINDITAP